jgi:hypothetical protein
MPVSRNVSKGLGRSRTPIAQGPAAELALIGDECPGGEEATSRRHRIRTGLLESWINANVGFRDLRPACPAVAISPAAAKPIACINCFLCMVPPNAGQPPIAFGGHNSEGRL